MFSKIIFNALKVFVVLGLVASLVGNGVLIWLSTEETPMCPAHWVNPVPIMEHNERSIVFADLSETELLQVRDYMSKTSGLNIVFAPDSPLTSDYLFMIDTSLPKKKDVLQYLDNNGPKPAREATAVVFHGSKQIIKEYVVGPLPNPTYHRDVTIERYQKNISFDARPVNVEEYALIAKLMRSSFETIKELLNESLGIDTAIYPPHIDNTPRALKTGERQTWFVLCRQVEGFYLQPVSFEIFIDHRSTDPSSWKIMQLFYNGRYFDSVDHLKQQYDTGNVTKVIYKPLPNYASLKPRQKPTGIGPQQFYMYGKRFSVKDNHVAYLDWTFAFGLSPVRGMRIFDVRFKGERIIYELSVQEALSVYGATNPNLMLTKFIDSGFGIGRFAYELTRGVDCPYSATYLDTYTYLDRGVPRRFRNSICVFEHDTGRPLRRHFSEIFYNSYGGLGNSVLVFRTITAIGNYDYLWDFIFYQSGSVEATVKATGYIASSYKLMEKDPYGHQVANNVTGNIHTHFVNYKVDLDVVGVKNIFQTKDMEFVNVSVPWRPERYATIPKLVENQLNTEQEAALRHDTKTPRYVHIASDKLNSWGQQRSYRLQVFSFAGDPFPEDQPEERAMSWSRYKVAITKQKDVEQTSSSLYNQEGMYDPPVDFSNYIADNESIVNEDLVAWVTVGFLHIPHAEDIPNTVTVGNGGGVLIRPHNYFDEDPSIFSTDSVYIAPGTEQSCENNRVACLTEETCTPVLEPFTYHAFDGGVH